MQQSVRLHMEYFMLRLLEISSAMKKKQMSFLTAGVVATWPSVWSLFSSEAKKENHSSLFEIQTGFIITPLTLK